MGGGFNDKNAVFIYFSKILPISHLSVGIYTLFLFKKINPSYIKYIVWVEFYGISTNVGYSMPNSVYTYTLNIYDLVWFYGISTIVGTSIFVWVYIGLVGRVFTNGQGDLGSIPGHVIQKTLKMVLATYLLNTQQYNIHIKGKVEQSRERSSALPYILV